MIERKSAAFKEDQAVLVGVIQKDHTEIQVNEYLDELTFLSETAGAIAVKRFTKDCRIPTVEPLWARVSWKKLNNT